MLSHNSRNSGARKGMLLNIIGRHAYVWDMMKTALYILAMSATVAFSQPAQAACYADYKAKIAQPLQLHYGVVQLPDNICSNNQQIRKNIAQRISRGGWTLLNVMSVFGPEGLSQRQDSAGNYYLKF